MCLICRVYKQIRGFESWVKNNSPGSNINVMKSVYQVAASCRHLAHAIAPPDLHLKRGTISGDADSLWTSSKSRHDTGINLLNVVLDKSVAPANDIFVTSLAAFNGTLTPINNCIGMP